MRHKTEGASRGFIWLLAGNLVSPVAGLLVTTIIARELGAEGRGTVAGATAPLMLFLGAMTLGIPEAATHFVARGLLTMSRQLWIVIAIVVAFGFAGLSLVAALSASTPDPVGQLMLVAGSALPVALLTGLMRAIAVGQQRWRLITLEKIIGAAIRVIVIGALASTGRLTELSATLVVAAGTFAGGVVYLRVMKGLPRRARDKIALSKILRFATIVWIGVLGGALAARLDQLLMVPLTTLQQLGLYAVAVTISEVGLMANAAIRDIVFARESASADDEFVASAVRISTAITFCLAVIIAIGSAVFTKAVFGEEFTGSVVPTLILLAGIVLGNPGSVSAASLTARGFPFIRTTVIWASVFVNVILVLLLVPQGGAAAAATATAAATVFSGATCAGILAARTPIRFTALLGIRRSDVSRAVHLFSRRGAR